MIDQIIIGDKASFDDFGASVAKRDRKKPKKKEIKETVPFSNVTHDFTKINGEIYWEEAKHDYVFEMDAATPEELEEMKTAFSSWVMNIIKEELHDPIVPDYHYIVTYDDMSYADEDELTKTTATVTFSAYPYKIANCPRRIELTNEMGCNQLYFENQSSHRIVPKIITDKPISGKFNDERFTMEAGTVEDEFFTLSPMGQVNNIILTAVQNVDVAHVTISFYEEVF